LVPFIAVRDREQKQPSLPASEEVMDPKIVIALLIIGALLLLVNTFPSPL